MDLDFPDDLRRLPRGAETALFRVVQECLANVQRQSGRLVAKIRLARELGSVVLEVEDEVRGIERAAGEVRRFDSRVGMGLKGMKERIWHLGGRLEVKSDSHGTAIKASVPMRQDF